MEYHEAAEADCTTDGNTEYWSCPACEKYFADAEGQAEVEADSWIIQAAGHKMVSTEDGNWKCTVCDRYFSDEEGQKEILS